MSDSIAMKAAPAVETSNPPYEKEEAISRHDLSAEELTTLDSFDTISSTASGGYSAVFKDGVVEFYGIHRANIGALLSMEPETAQGIKATILSIASSSKISPPTLAVRLRSFNRAVTLSKVNKITRDLYPRLIKNLSNSDVNAIALFLIHWHKLGYAGVDDATIDVVNLEQRSWTIYQKRITSGDPTQGWYTQQEYDDLVQTYWDDYEAGRKSLVNTVVLLLNAQYGRRGLQYAHLKVCDFQEEGETDGVSGKRVEFPGVKDKGSDQWFRGSKSEVHPMGDDLWSLCQTQISESVEAFESHFGRTLPSEERLQLPFLQIGQRHHKRSMTRRAKSVQANSTLLEQLDTPIWHMSGSSIAQMCQRAYGTLVFSHVTGEPIYEFAYRMRYTRARQLARLGVSRKVLSYWLGHESLKSIDHYYDDPAEDARKLNDDIKPILSPLAQAFAGTLRDSEAHASRGGDPSTRVELDGRKAVGSCGSDFCTASVPIPCYRCSKFEPWVDGPHEEVLLRLYERQEEENNIHIPSSARSILRPLQLTKDIDAVKLVIRLCDARKAELAAKAVVNAGADFHDDVDDDH
ncbi:site-specific integrase [Pseudomonas atacamensis]|uniref:Site-specific integrase n=1 Tax=Pseudomonas atacamensis TaxID=2565368 RepID=A0AAQ2I2J6_9PSED|nr:site-specific integrase [Pseudomonas atacamensis]THF34467.1 site-specific integrase [Pseudomonas atacamensis]